MAWWMFYDLGKSTGGTAGWTVSGTVAYDGTEKGFKCTSGASGAVATFAKNSNPANGRLVFRFKATDLPSGDLTILDLSVTTVGRFWLRLTSGGAFKITDAAGTQRGTGGSISTGTEYRICVVWNVTNTTTNHIKLFIDGAAAAIDITNVTLSSSASANTLFGWGTASVGNSKVIYFKEFYMDNDSGLTDLGNVRVTFKKPASDNVVTYDTFTPSDPGAGSRYTLVNHNPIDEANCLTQGATAAQTANFGIEAIGVGEVDLTNATLLGYWGWMWAKISSTSGSPAVKITLNGVDTAKTLTTSPAYYSADGADANYPSNAAVIGQKSSGSAGDTFLYECGVIFAYIPYVAQNYTETALAWTMTNTPDSFTYWSDLALASSITLTPDSFTYWSDLALNCGISAVPDETDSRSDSDLALAIAASLIPEGTDVSTFYDLVRAIGASIDVILTDIAAFKDLSTTYGIILSPESTDGGAFNEATAYAISIVPVAADSNGYAENVMVVLTALPEGQAGQGYYDLGEFPLGILVDKSESRTMSELIRQVAALLNVAETDIFHQAVVPGPPVQGFFIIQRPKAPNHYKELALM